MRGVWCQALSLPRPPIPWGGQPGFRDPCFPGTVGVGVGTQHGPHSMRHCEPSLCAVGPAGGRPRGRCLAPLCGASEFRRCPSPDARPQGGLSGSATHVLWARVCGRRGSAPSLWFACPAGGCMPRRWLEAVTEGVAFHRCRGRLVSGAVPPRAGRPLGQAARVPCPVSPGHGWCGRGSPAPARQRASRRCALWGWREGVPGGDALRRCEERPSSGALPPPAASPLGGLSVFATHVLWARVSGRRGPARSLWLACPARGSKLRGWWEAFPGGQAFHRC